MKKIFFIGALFILFAYNSQGQGIYSLENLKHSSPEILRTYLTSAEKNRKLGGNLETAGVISVVTGFVVVYVAYNNSSNDALLYAGAGMFYFGILTALVGIPVRITGSTRVNRINSILNNSSGVSLEIAPCHFQNFTAQKSQTGITLRLRF